MAAHVVWDKTSEQKVEGEKRRIVVKFEEVGADLLDDGLPFLPPSYVRSAPPNSP